MSEHIIRDIQNPGRISRRDVLRYSLAGAGLVALGPLSKLVPVATGAPQNLKRLVVVNCYGGNDTLNMFVPVKLSNYYTRRVGLAIPEAEALSLATGGSYGTSNYRLHPAMPKIAAMWGEGKVAAVNRVGYPNADTSHFISQDIFSYGVRGSFGPLGIPMSGWIARFCDHYAPTPLGAVTVNVGRPRDIVGGTTSPLPVSRLSSFKINGSGSAHVHRLNAAKGLIASFSGTGRAEAQKTTLEQAHSLTTQVAGALTSYTSNVVYPNESLANQMKDIAVLIQGGFETRIFYTGIGGFDTHDQQGMSTGSQANLFARIDNALAAFADDMKAMGTWNDTVVVLITEFGRRNYVNGNFGTDHGHAYAVLMLGGAVRGGAYGPDLTEADLQAEFPTYGVDFRSIYKEILDRHMGTNPAPVFPEALQTETTLGIV